MRRLFEGGAYLKLDATKKSFLLIERYILTRRWKTKRTQLVPVLGLFFDDLF